MRIAIVEDHREDQQRLSSFIGQYFRETAPEIKQSIVCFDNAVDFLENYQAIYDIVFLDIQMPLMDGMTAVEKLRRLDEQVPVIFATSMAQYAVRGYNVNAVGFVLKPIRYHDFFLSMRRAVALAALKVGQTILISDKQGMERIVSSDLVYVEVSGHMLRYHTVSGIVCATGSLNELEERLKPSDFLRCNSCYLVNPRHIRRVQGYELIMDNGEMVQISHPKKKAFMEALNRWLGEGKNL